MVFIFPVKDLIITQARIPNIIPLAMEYVRGIIKTARYALNTSAISPSNLIFAALENISIPT